MFLLQLSVPLIFLTLNTQIDAAAKRCNKPKAEPTSCSLEFENIIVPTKSGNISFTDLEKLRCNPIDESKRESTLLYFAYRTETDNKDNYLSYAAPFRFGEIWINVRCSAENENGSNLVRLRELSGDYVIVKAICAYNKLSVEDFIESHTETVNSIIVEWYLETGDAS